MTQVQVCAPYASTFDHNVIEPDTGTLRTVRFDHGVAVLDADDPAVLVFRGLAELSTRTRRVTQSWSVTSVKSPQEPAR